jgi:transcriptional regulator with XRE-family HTH domain
MDLKLARNLAGYTQIQLAERIGISQTAYSQIETGRTYPRKVTRDKIEKILDMKVDWLSTRMQNDTATKPGIRKDGVVDPEERIIAAIQEYIQTGQLREQGERFAFLRGYIEKYQNALIKEQKKGRRKDDKKSNEVSYFTNTTR